MSNRPSPHSRGWCAGQERVKQQHTDWSSREPNRSAHTPFRSVGWSARAERFPAACGGPGHPGADAELKEPRFWWLWSELDWSAWDGEDQTSRRKWSPPCVWCSVCNEALCFLHRCRVCSVLGTVRLRTGGCRWPACPGTAPVLL